MKCKGCTYSNAKANDVFCFDDLHQIASLDPEQIIIAGGGEPTLYNSKGMHFSDFIYKLKELLPNTSIRVVTNGVFVPPGDWTRLVDSIKISMYGFNENDYRKYVGRKNCYNLVVNNILKYIKSGIDDITISPLVSRENCLQIPEFIETFWNLIDEKIRVEEISLYSKKIAIRLTPYADDTCPDDPYHKANLDDEMQDKWADAWTKIENKESKFSQYYRNLLSSNVENKGHLILPFESTTKKIYNLAVEGKDVCQHVNGYVLVGSEGIIYPCPIIASMKGPSLGHVKMSGRELYHKRHDCSINPPSICRLGCRMPETYCGKLVLNRISRA